MRTLVCLVLPLCVMFSLAGCGGSGSKPQEDKVVVPQEDSGVKGAEKGRISVAPKP